MFKVLVVEDDVVYYRDYFSRILGSLVPLEDIEITHTPDMLSACKALTQPWNLIFMDYYLGAPIKLFGDTIKNGADLARLRITLEAQEDKENRTPMVGIASSMAVNRILYQSGIRAHFRKDNIEGMAEFIKERMKHGK